MYILNAFILVFLVPLVFTWPVPEEYITPPPLTIYGVPGSHMTAEVNVPFTEEGFRGLGSYTQRKNGNDAFEVGLKSDDNKWAAGISHEENASTEYDAKFPLGNQGSEGSVSIVDRKFEPDTYSLHFDGVNNGWKASIIHSPELETEYRANFPILDTGVSGKASIVDRASSPDTFVAGFRTSDSRWSGEINHTPSIQTEYSAIFPLGREARGKASYLDRFSSPDSFSVGAEIPILEKGDITSSFSHTPGVGNTVGFGFNFQF